VFREIYGQPVMSRVQDFCNRVLSADQRAHLARFAAGVRRGQAMLADPVQRAALEAVAKQTHRRLTAVANRAGY